MANVKLKSIGVSDKDAQSIKKKYLYKDVLLDLKPEYSYNAQFNKQERLKDIDVLYDVEAVKNSIVNCFLTIPGQKILNPLFGMDLRSYVFEPVNNYTTELIRHDITDRLPKMEPRITIENVSVEANIDEQQYDIIMQINVPSLDVYGLSLEGKLNNNGYTLI